MPNKQQRNASQIKEATQKMIEKVNQSQSEQEQIQRQKKMSDEPQQFNTSQQEEQQISQSSDEQQKQNIIQHQDIQQQRIQKNIEKNQSKLSEKQKIQKIQKQSQRSQQSIIKKNELNNKTNHKYVTHNKNIIQKHNQPFYQQTYYITGVKENFLLLLSDNNQVLQFPVGMFQTQKPIITNFDDDSEQDRIERPKNTLMKDIRIGQPIKIKLEVDYERQEKDRAKFNRLQQSLNKEYT